MSARSIGAIVLLGVGLGLVSGCTSHRASDGAKGSTTSTIGTTLATTTTRPSGPTTTAAPTGPTMFFPDRDGAVNHLINAWKFGRKDLAALGADRTAVDNLFTQPAAGYSLYECDTGEFTTSNCNYRNRPTNGYAQITAEKQAKGWVVTAVAISTDG